MTRCCVFAHFDQDDKVDEYVLYYLSQLLENVDNLQFVTTSKLSQSDLDRLKTLGVNVIQRDNVGYDFFSYKTGLEALTMDYDEVVLCNDSVYGPFFNLSDLFRKMANVECDFWGVTESYEIAHHLQSYFLVFRQSVIDAPSFWEFWRTMEILSDRRQVIQSYEIGLSQKLLSRGFSSACVIQTANQSFGRRIMRSLPQFYRRFRLRWKEGVLYRHLLEVLLRRKKLEINTTHLEWKTTLATRNTPFLKIELLRDNPMQVAEVDQALGLISSISNYPTALISNHLERVK
ncbi:MAG: hypothetical protein HOC23_18880 [Halieaceae bacterium]|jgi:lipopolysaccharide biosynthesis protein|nr:hypothetical protein [Halieaceae bacterium]